MSQIQRKFLWAGVIGVLPLATLSTVGYLPLTAEYLIAAVLSLLLGFGLSKASSVRILGSVLLVLVTSVYIALYFGDLIIKSTLLQLFLVGIVLLVICFRSHSKFLTLAGVVGYVQIITAALLTPSSTVSLKEAQVVRSDLPPVIHLMLDEHPGTGSFLSDAIDPARVKAFEDAYVRHGFVVFRHAYTADRLTEQSLSRLFNVGAPDISATYRFNADADALADNYLMLQASGLDEISKTRALDITQTQYLNFEQALKNNPAVARDLIYNIRDIRTMDSYTMTMHDRLTLASYLMVNRWRKRIAYSLAGWLLSHADSETISKMESSRQVFAFEARFIIQQFTERLSCCGERGTYYFMHLLMPHFSYILNEQCQVNPVGGWRHRDPSFATPEHQMDNRRHFYELAFGQSSCAAQDVFTMVDALQQNKAMSDAVILVHSDHGARIDMMDSEPHKKGLTQRDWRGSFIAIKIPDMQGRVVDTPVRLDALYANLLEHNFRTLDIDKLKPDSDSPY